MIENPTYILADSVIEYFLEKYVKDLIPEKYIKFLQSIEDKRSIIVEETKKASRMFLQNSDNIEVVEAMVSFPINNTIAGKLMSLLKKEEYNFVNYQVRSKYPVSIPFVLATAIINGAVVVVDMHSKEGDRYKKLCAIDNVPCMGIPEYIKSL